MSDTEGTEDKEVMCIYKEEKKDAKRKNGGWLGERETLTINRQYKEK